MIRVTASDSELTLSPLVGAVAGISLTLGLVIIALGIRARRASRSSGRAPPHSEEKLWPPSQGSTGGTVAVGGIKAVVPNERVQADAISVDDREPDVIPANYGDPPPVYGVGTTAPGGVISSSAKGGSATPVMSSQTPTAIHESSGGFMNGPGSSWTWGPRPKELCLAQARLGDGHVTTTLGRHVTPDRTQTAVVTTRIPHGMTTSQTQHVVSNYGGVVHQTDALNVEAIKEKLLDNRIPESCV